MNPAAQHDAMIEGLLRGDDQSFRDFWAQFGPALQRLAGKQMTAALQRRVGPEDVVQSVCRTFFRRAQGGEFQLSDSESLWRLLCAITFNKIRKQARFHFRLKRGLDQELRLGAEDTTGGAAELPAAGPTPDEAIEFADQFQALMAALDDEAQRVVDLKLQQFKNEEIASQMRCSERTVRRILKRVQSQLRKQYELDREPPDAAS